MSTCGGGGSSSTCSRRSRCSRCSKRRNAMFLKSTSFFVFPPKLPLSSTTALTFSTFWFFSGSLFLLFLFLCFLFARGTGLLFFLFAWRTWFLLSGFGRRSFHFYFCTFLRFWAWTALFLGRQCSWQSSSYGRWIWIWPICNSACITFCYSNRLHFWFVGYINNLQTESKYETHYLHFNIKINNWIYFSLQKLKKIQLTIIIMENNSKNLIHIFEIVSTHVYSRLQKDSIQPILLLGLKNDFQRPILSI